MSLKYIDRYGNEENIAGVGKPGSLVNAIGRLSSGTAIGDIVIDGAVTTFYAPTPTAIPNSRFTIKAGTLDTNHSYKLGNAVTLNLTIRASTTANQTLVLLTLPSGYYPTNSAVACFATVNGTLTNSWIRNQTGELCVVTPSTLTNIEIKVITTYIVI